MPSRSRFALGFEFALAIVAVARPGVAHAESRAIVVAVDATSDVAADDVRSAVAAELDAAVARPADAAPESAGRLDVSSRGGVVHVTFRDGHGRTLTREVTAPPRGADRVRLIALLAGNLARNEAEELARPAESSVAPPAPTPTPEPAEVAPPAPTAPRLAWSDAPSPRRASGQRTGGWITFGGSLAVGGAGLVLAMTAQTATSDLQTTCAPSCTASRMDALHARVVVADLLLGVGAIGTVTGIVLVLTAPSAKAPVAVEVGGRSIGIAGAF